MLSPAGPTVAGMSLLPSLTRDRKLWRIDTVDMSEFAGTNKFRQSQVNRWLSANGLPSGEQLRGGSLCTVVDGRERVHLCAQLLDGTQLQVPMRANPPAGLKTTDWAAEEEAAREAKQPPQQ